MRGVQLRPMDEQVLEHMRIPIYKNPEKPVEVRVKDLLFCMELKEKIGQMTQIERRVANPQIVRDFCIGGVLSCTGSRPFKKALSGDWAEMVNDFQRGAVKSRLGIPLLYGVDAVHGNGSVPGEMRLAELEEDFRCRNGMPHLRVKSGIFKHAASSLSDLGTKIVKQKLMEAMKILENDEEIANVMGNLNKKDNQINNNVSSNECPVLKPPIIRAKGVTNA
ncbi:hypothetical protein FEM48_Zijuj02G0056900 [Ziziphus jujuba var. spinosa]|uniref:Glycoside hydrolase family 3 N-terminal domain-containing protein n=1 Tax=Ziziphus jujuba var. spinosa TaxID=714518 RepID=A0A978VTY6_ZIZJJ|nr:hypothetical protein FEM48_Zijuj02G0056900 [Ziziphus jujuba var. spinosa]